MPKQKTRRRRNVAHYVEHPNVIQGKSAGKRGYRPIGKPIVKKHTAYFGSSITASNRRDYMSKQAEMFKERHIAEVIRKRDEIKKKDISEDEMNVELDAFNKEQLTDEQLEMSSRRFAIFQVNKENKHYKAWLKNKAWYRYKGNRFPVISQEFLDKTETVKPIEKIENDTGNKDGSEDTVLTGDVTGAPEAV